MWKDVKICVNVSPKCNRHVQSSHAIQRRPLISSMKERAIDDTNATDDVDAKPKQERVWSLGRASNLESSLE